MIFNRIPIDFVAGSHGHFLENVLNKYFNIAEVEGSAFTSLGTSHYTSENYVKNRLFWANHWSELFKSELANVSKIISIRFDQDDLLLLSSVSLLRAGDLGIDNTNLEINTVSQLNNRYYQDTLELIYKSYPFLNRNDQHIPRYVLREFYKFGFKDPESNGYWHKLKDLKYTDPSQVFYFDFKDFYNIDLLVNRIKKLETFVDRTFDFSTDFYQQHQKFLSFVPYVSQKEICDDIVLHVQQEKNIPIPTLTLFQESYVNAQLENIYKKEMPFHQDEYFKSTKEVLQHLSFLKTSF
jgi:hypothetical protein